MWPSSATDLADLHPHPRPHSFLAASRVALTFHTHAYDHIRSLVNTYIRKLNLNFSTRPPSATDRANEQSKPCRGKYPHPFAMHALFTEGSVYGPSTQK
eukprot:359979-Chlamydomonas_euryale.AAC.3